MQKLIPNRIYRAEYIANSLQKGDVYMFKYERTEEHDPYHIGPYIDRTTNTAHKRGDFYDTDYIFELMPEIFELENFLCQKN